MFWTPRWLVRHAVAALLVGAFLALGWWQVDRAVGGNVLSYAYAVEWPVFAGFVVFVWYKEVRRAGAEGHQRSDPLPPVRSTRPARVGPGYDDGYEDRGEDGGDAQLAAYNRYLAWLAANPQARPTDYREG